MKNSTSPPSPDSSASKKIRWGIVGCGDVCEVKSGPAFQKATGSELVAVMRRDAAKASDFAQRHNVPKWTTDTYELIADPEIDAIYIATPPGSHCELALAVAEVGKPCYVEKPMARNHRECCIMNEAFEAAGIPLFVAYYRRRLPRFVQVKALLASGKLGKLTKIEYLFRNASYRNVDREHLPWRLQPEFSGGGLLLDLGSHLLDLLDELFGPLTMTEGTSANVSKLVDLPDCANLSFLTGEGIPGTGQWDFASFDQKDLLTIVGQNGAIELSCFGNEPMSVKINGEQELLDRPNPSHVHQPLVQTLVNQLLGRGENCPSTGISAARTSLIMEKIESSKASF